MSTVATGIVATPKASRAPVGHALLARVITTSTQTPSETATGKTALTPLIVFRSLWLSI